MRRNPTSREKRVKTTTELARNPVVQVNFLRTKLPTVTRFSFEMEHNEAALITLIDEHVSIKIKAFKV